MADTIRVTVPAFLVLTIEKGEVTGMKISASTHTITVINEDGWPIHVGQKTADKVQTAVDNSDWPVLRQELPPGIEWEG